MTTQGNSKNCCDTIEPLWTLEEVKALDTVERIKCTISREEFFEHYEKSRRPVILKNCGHAWPARSWSFESLLERFPDDSVWNVTFDKKQDEWKRAQWKEIKDAYASQDFFYISDQLTDPASQSLLKDYQVPEAFRDADLYAPLTDFPKDHGPRRWFEMGRKTSGTDPQMGVGSTDTWSTAIAGSRWWVIFDHSVTEQSLACDPSCSSPDRTPTHWYATVAMHAKKRKTMHVLQKPGETLFLPHGHIYSVYNFEDSLGITEKYASPADVHEAWTFVCSEGTVDHRRQFYFFSLNQEQRNELLLYSKHRRNEALPKQLEIPEKVFKLLQENGENLEPLFKLLRQNGLKVLLIPVLLLGLIVLLLILFLCVRRRRNKKAGAETSKKEL